MYTLGELFAALLLILFRFAVLLEYDVALKDHTNTEKAYTCTW